MNNVFLIVCNLQYSGEDWKCRLQEGSLPESFFFKSANLPQNPLTFFTDICHVDFVSAGRIKVRGNESAENFS
jgi:hypothetical protein